MNRLVLSDGTPPPGADGDFWRELSSPERFAAALEAAIEAVERPGDVGEWVPIDELNGFAVDAYVTGRRPPGHRRAVGHALRAADHMLAAWVMARETILRHAGGAATVTLTLRPYDVYELGELLRDVVDACDQGVRRGPLRSHLDARRRAWYAARPSPSLIERGARRAGRSLVPLEQALPRALGALDAVTKP